MTYSHIEAAQEFSASVISDLRTSFSERFQGRPYSIVVGGSFARREASRESDLDLFVITDGGDSRKAAADDMPEILELARTQVTKAAATNGAFEQHECIDDMIENVGGQKDLNDKFTRRILFLLEGEWLFGADKFKTYRRKVLDRYVKPAITEHQLVLFFLNDLIRYYRTVCVDFEYKTFEDGKAWGDRNLKLLFSRKLLYFSGIIVAAETCQRTYTQKMSVMEDLLSVSPLQRVQKICGHKLDRVLQYYNDFLGDFSKHETRLMVRKVTDDRETHSEEFRKIKNAGHHFSMELAKVIRDVYDISHPIHRALIL